MEQVENGYKKNTKSHVKVQILLSRIIWSDLFLPQKTIDRYNVVMCLKDQGIERMLRKIETAIFVFHQKCSMP
jgi:hypothetical protein